MAAITITPASIAYVSGPIIPDIVAGEAFTAGQSIYKADNGQWLKAQGDGTAVEAGANGAAVALATAAAAGARLSAAGPGAIVTYGAVITPGTIYIIGDTAGAIYPAADAGSGDKVTVLGLGISTTQMMIQPVYNSGSQLA